ncbi:MAG: GntR family transcriptional regulator [Acidimicrobiia bacterium]
MLNRHSGIPLYRQLSELLETQVVRDLEPEERLPSEGTLAHEFGVNRLTVRHALADLARQGLIETLHGKGSFATGAPHRYEVAVGGGASFTEAMEASGRMVELRLLRTAGDDDPEIRRVLRTRGSLRRYEQLRLVDGVPWSLSTTWLVPRRWPDLDRHWKGDTSLYRVLEGHYGVSMRRSARTFTAVAAGARDAEHLMVPVGSPILVVSGLNVGPDGEPLAAVEHRNRGDRIVFTVTP